MKPTAAACCWLSAILSRASEAIAYTAVQQLSYLQLLSPVMDVTLPLILNH